jgi:hypothetical protein
MATRRAYELVDKIVEAGRATAGGRCPEPPRLGGAEPRFIPRTLGIPKPRKNCGDKARPLSRSRLRTDADGHYASWQLRLILIGLSLARRMQPLLRWKPRAGDAALGPPEGAAYVGA